MDDQSFVRGLPRLGDLFRYHLGTILAAAALGLGFAAVAVTNLPQTYTSTAVVLLSPAPGNPLTAEAASGSLVQMTVALETEAQMLRTTAVAEVVEGVRGQDALRPGESLDVSVPSNTQMLRVSFTSTTPELAQEGAQAYVEGYLAYRAENARSIQDSRQERLREQIDEADAELRRAIGDASDSDGARYASHEVQLLVDRLAQLNTALSSTEAVSTDPGSVIAAAERPTTSNELPPWVVLGAGGAIGLLAGLAVALLWEWRRDLLRSSDNYAALGTHVLADIRPSVAGTDSLSGDSERHESYRQLRTAVVAKGSRPHVLAVAEVRHEAIDHRVGSTPDVAVNLAVVLTEAKFNVLLISTTAHQAEIARVLGVDPGPGIAEAAVGLVAAKDAIVPTSGLSLLLSGSEAPGARDVTASSAFREIVDELSPDFDYVILAAAAAGSADGDAVLLDADSALLVLEPGATTRHLLNATLDRLTRLGISVMGAVMISQSNPRRKQRAGEVHSPASAVS